MARVPVGEAFQIILMFRLCIPEIAHRLDLCHKAAGPDSRRIHIGNRIQRDLLLRIIHIVNG